MAIIYSYPLNDDIKPLDELVGTTEKNINGQLKTVTRNFLLQDLAEFFIVDGGLQKTITLTTSNSSGPSTLDDITGVLNIPNYSEGIADSPITIVNDSSLFSTGLYGTGDGSNATNSNFFGNEAGYAATNASGSNFFGNGAGDGGINAYNSNFIGNGAGKNAANAHWSNFLGYDAGNNASDANNSVLIGFNVGSAIGVGSIGSNNIIIGTNISLSPGVTNSLNLGGVLFGTGSYSDTLGGPSIVPTSGGKIGIGVVEPTNTLHIYSEAEDTSGLRLERLTSSSPTTAGQAIGVDASGNIVTVEGGGGGSQDLQSVTDKGSTTTNGISIDTEDTYEIGLYAISSAIGISGESRETYGVYGNSPSSAGVYGNSDNGYGVQGYSESGVAVYGNSQDQIGVQGYSYSGRAISATSDIGTGLHSYSESGVGVSAASNSIGLEVNGNGTIAIEANLGNSNKGLVINSGTSSTGNFIELDKNGVDKLTVNQAGELTATKLIKQGGTSAQLLAANGDSITAGTNITISGGTISSTGGGGGGATNLSTTQTASNFTINSDTGTDASVPLGNGTSAGATLNDYTTAEKNKLAAITGTNTGDQNLQSVTNLGATTTNTIIINAPGANPALTGYSSGGFGVYGQSSGIGVYGYSLGDRAVYGYAESVNGIAVSGYSEDGIGAEFETDSLIGANIVNFKKSGVIKASVGNGGDITANSFIKSGGTASQILAADGSVITAGTNITITGGQISSVGGAGGGGSSVNYYLNGGTPQGIIGGVPYYEFSKTAVIGTGTDFIRSSNGYIASFITDVADPSLLLIPAGNWNLEFFFSASSNGGSPSFYVELYKYDGTTFTSIASNSATPEGITGGTAIDAYFTPLAVPETILTVNDRLAIRVFVNASSKTITLHTQNGHLCEVITTFTAGLTALNGLQAQVQNFATGTTGTDFDINSSGSTHTFNLPSASATARGVVTTGTQTFAGGKTFTGSVNIENSLFVSTNTDIAISAVSQDSDAISAEAVNGIGVYGSSVNGIGVYGSSVNGLGCYFNTVSGGANIAEFTTNFVEKAKIDSDGIITGTGLNASGQTINTIASFDGSKNVVSLPTATYPSLTELTYAKGVTSAIQTQLDNKIAKNVAATYTTNTITTVTAAEYAAIGTKDANTLYFIV